MGRVEDTLSYKEISDSILTTCFNGSDAGFSINLNKKLNSSTSLDANVTLVPRIYSRILDPFFGADSSNTGSFSGVLTYRFEDLITNISYSDDGVTTHTVVPFTETISSSVVVSLAQSKNFRLGVSGCGDFSAFDFHLTTGNNFRTISSGASSTFQVTKNSIVGMKVDIPYVSAPPQASIAAYHTRKLLMLASIIDITPSYSFMASAKFFLGPVSTLNAFVAYDHATRKHTSSYGYTLAINQSLVSASVNTQGTVASRYLRQMTPNSSLDVTMTQNFKVRTFSLGITLNLLADEQ